MEVILPGGLLDNGCLENRARFRPLTGRLEQTLIELEMSSGRPGYVTAVLNAALERIGNRQVDVGLLKRLCVADRQYLMLRLAALLDGEQVWMRVDCAHCDARFDVEIQRCDLPVKKAGKGYPVVTMHINDCEISVRVPTGEDQQSIEDKPDGEALLELLQNCVRLIDGECLDDDYVSRLSGSDIEAIDAALDEASPAVCNQLLVSCPECSREQHVELDHYALNGMNRYLFYDEVHTLASHYHWSEEAILDLPQTRRHLYLDMINRSNGMNG